MKLKYFFFLIALGILACESDPDDFGSVGAEIYQLRTVNIPVTGLIIYERGLDITETLTLESDSTFVKERILESDSVLTSHGLYSKLRIDGKNFLKFEHEENNFLIKNCNQGLVEFMSIIDDTHIYNGSAATCNGPGYSYERIE